MKLMRIYHDSVVDGEGLRTVIFFAGCPHHCYGCHNPGSWNINNGIEYTVEAVLLEILSNPLTNVTFSGGDPFFQAKEAVRLAEKVKEAGKNLWCYTGYTLEEIKVRGNNDQRELLSLIDTLVDGRFILAERDVSLPFRGSQNQRILRLHNE